MGLPFLITLRNAGGYEIYKKEILPENPVGKIGYSPDTADTFRICLSFPSSSWYHRAIMKVSVSFDINGGNVELASVVTKSSLTKLEHQLHFTLSRVESFYAESEYEQSQEDSLERNFKKINKRIVWINIVQISIAFCASLLIVFNLTRFFRAQKIV
ncbi:transmembrane protein [Cardiosporidium cionae]|uniref:Transmembrane protein n=1 Tax=Cardiosporidium cionae TaxID=476202 RepID=A0ABQ7J6Z6_9APIC|nr:transmembrane protein [Cardiosporidium cionae]|eukprot:KAF8819755.1 transmembrane protein [Cardiosporidium cionae]